MIDRVTSLLAVGTLMVGLLGVREGLSAEAINGPSYVASAADNGGSILLPYQQRWVQDRSAWKVCEKSRQVGISFAEAFAKVVERLEGTRVCNHIYSSADESAAEIYIGHCKFWLSLYEVAAEFAEAHEIIGGVKVRVMSITFPPVSDARGVLRQPVIMAMSSSPTSMRSKSGDVTLDEFAHHRDEIAMWKAAEPVTMRAFNIAQISTHNGEHTLHNQTCERGRRARRGDGRPGDELISLHTIPLQLAVDEGLVESINRLSGSNFTREEFVAKCRARCLSESQWLEEYCCIPSADASSYFPLALTRPLVVPIAGPVTSDVTVLLSNIQRLVRDHDGVTVAAGCDVGRHEDPFVLWANVRIGGRWIEAGAVELRDRPFDLLESVIVVLMNATFESKHASARRVRRLCIDKTGIGEMLAERMEKKYRTRVESIAFTNESKAHLAEQMRMVCEEAAIGLHDDDVTLTQFASIRKTQTKTNKDRYDSARDDTGHSDRFWACSLAVEAGADYGRGEFRGVGVSAW